MICNTSYVIDLKSFTNKKRFIANDHYFVSATKVEKLPRRTVHSSLIYFDVGHCIGVPNVFDFISWL